MTASSSKFGKDAKNAKHAEKAWQKSVTTVSAAQSIPASVSRHGLESSDRTKDWESTNATRAAHQLFGRLSV